MELVAEEFELFDEKGQHFSESSWEMLPLQLRELLYDI